MVCSNALRLIARWQHWLAKVPFGTAELCKCRMWDYKETFFGVFDNHSSRNTNTCSKADCCANLPSSEVVTESVWSGDRGLGRQCAANGWQVTVIGANKHQRVKCVHSSAAEDRTSPVTLSRLYNPIIPLVLARHSLLLPLGRICLRVFLPVCLGHNLTQAYLLIAC